MPVRLSVSPPSQVLIGLRLVDIKELKLLGGFDHPNIVRFVSVVVEA